MWSWLKRCALVFVAVVILGLGSFAIASKISVGVAVSFPVDI